MPAVVPSLVGTEDALLQQLADSMLKADCTSELKVHLARSLPLPCSVNRPRIDLIVFVVNLHSKLSLQSVEESLCHLDAAFFLGKVAFLATGAGRDSHCSIHRNTVVKLAHTYRSPLLFCDLEVRTCSRGPWDGTVRTQRAWRGASWRIMSTRAKGLLMWRPDPRWNPGFSTHCLWVGHREPWVHPCKVG
uniref:Centromere protein M n=1 Tax=Bos indicus x Bos taurus TaxID=30522 RepID=A0A4W2F654_BOBOX